MCDGTVHEHYLQFFFHSLKSSTGGKDNVVYAANHYGALYLDTGQLHFPIYLTTGLGSYGWAPVSGKGEK